MTKRKNKPPQLEAWCWYCDREFEDERVLLQHQKSKHYRCPQCPRRLNTAGGLAVHLTQVHKAEPDRIENTLPGRDTFDFEIYGMAGIPEKDMEEWRARRLTLRAEGALNSLNKRPRIEKLVLTKEQLGIQLEAHKALMSGKTPMPGFGAPGGMPPPGGPYSVPPPPVSGMYGGPPPSMMSRPPPSIPPPGYGPPPFVGGSAGAPPLHTGPPPTGSPAR